MSRCDFDGWSDVIGEVPWCLSMQTTVRHEAELESDPLWHVQPVQFVVQECRQTTVKLPRVADCSIEMLHDIALYKFNIHIHIHILGRRR